MERHGHLHVLKGISAYHREIVRQRRRPTVGGERSALSLNDQGGVGLPADDNRDTTSRVFQANSATGLRPRSKQVRFLKKYRHRRLTAYQPRGSNRGHE